MNKIVVIKQSPGNWARRFGQIDVGMQYCKRRNEFIGY